MQKKTPVSTLHAELHGHSTSLQFCHGFYLSLSHRFLLFYVLVHPEKQQTRSLAFGNSELLHLTVKECMFGQSPQDWWQDFPSWTLNRNDNFQILSCFFCPWKLKALPAWIDCAYWCLSETFLLRLIYFPIIGFIFPYIIFFAVLVTQSRPTLSDPMDYSSLGLSVHHHLPESTQTQVHWVGDAIQPSHPLSSPSPPALNLSQHQGLFKWVSSLHQVAKGLEFQLQHQFFQWMFRVDFP